MIMTENQLLTAIEAASLANVPYSTFMYHVYRGNVPGRVLFGGRYAFLREYIITWKKPLAKKRGRRKKADTTQLQ